MTGRFRAFGDPPALSFAGQAFVQQMELWMMRASYRSDRDVRPLERSAAEFLRARCDRDISLYGPTIAALWFALMDFETGSKTRAVMRWFLRALQWWGEFVTYRGRPMWNDYRMCLWQLSRDPRYIGDLYKHIARARRKKLADQFETAVWMVTSVCQQDPEFAEHWGDLIVERGDVFAGVP